MADYYLQLFLSLSFFLFFSLFLVLFNTHTHTHTHTLVPLLFSLHHTTLDWIHWQRSLSLPRSLSFFPVLSSSSPFSFVTATVVATLYAKEKNNNNNN